MALCTFSTPTQRHQFEIQTRKFVENIICLPGSAWTAESPTFRRVQPSRSPPVLRVVVNKHVVGNSQHVSIHVHRCWQHDLQISRIKGTGVELVSQKVVKGAKLFCQTSIWLTRDGPELWDEPCSRHLDGLAASCNNSRASRKKRLPFAHVLSRICAPAMPRWRSVAAGDLTGWF